VCHALYPIRTGPSVTSPSRDPGTALPSEPDGPRRPDILVRSEQRAGWARIHGCDRGIGLPATQLDRFFEPFVRLHAADVYPGTGIRFAFVRSPRRALEGMGGRVGAESELGAGSDLWIELREVTR